MDDISLAAGILLGASGITILYTILHRLSPLYLIIDPFFRPRDKVRVITNPASSPKPEDFINDIIQSFQEDGTNPGYIGYSMHRDDWKPLVDAMEYLSNLPQCGDVARRLLSIFKAARAGKYYYIEMGYEGQDSQCFIISQEFAVDKTKGKKET